MSMKQDLYISLGKAASRLSLTLRNFLIVGWAVPTKYR